MDTSVCNQRWAPALETDGVAVFEYSAGSHLGRVRAVNEDAFLAGPPVFVVADGMGGHARGDVASALVVDAFQPLVGGESVGPADLSGAITRSRVGIAALGEDLDAPGSTVIVAAYVIESGHAYWLVAHEGDSRAYLFSGGELRQLTRDHSLVQELVDAGELAPDEAMIHPDRHVVTRAIGALIDTEPEFSLVPVQEGSRLLLCSDGLTSELSSDSIAVLLAQSRTSKDAVDSLLRAAVQAGGHDNITAMVIDVVSVDQEPAADTVVPDGVRVDTLPRVLGLP